MARYALRALGRLLAGVCPGLWMMSKAREQAGESTQAAARDGEIREGDEVGATITVFEGAKSRFFVQNLGARIAFMRFQGWVPTR